MRNFGSGATREMERQLDTLIDDLSHNLSDSRKYTSSDNRYNVYETKSYYEERAPSRKSDVYGSSGSLTRSISPSRAESSHRDYLHAKYTRDSSRSLSGSAMEDNKWNRSRSGTYTEFGPSGTGRPFSVLSKSPAASPYASRQGSRAVTPEPILRNKYAHSRSVSPKNVHIGPVTEMIEFKRELERAGQQEYFRGRDSRQGKPLSGRHGYMNYSWPYGLNHIGDDYENENLRLPYQSPKESSVPPLPTPPIHRRSKSVEPIAVKKLPVRSRSAMSTPIPDHMMGLKHIVVEQVPVPIPPRFGTLTYGGRYPNSADRPITGPPCELCQKPITEGRCIYADNAQYHCWHFYCSFCSKVLRENDFLVAQDNKPYCVNCFKREYP